MPYFFAVVTASTITSGVVVESAAKMPPVWNQRTPSRPKIRSQSRSPFLSCEAALLARSEQPTAPRMPKPRSVKFRPTRVFRPMPSKGTHWTYSISTPPCSIRSSSSRPTGLSTMAVTIAARLPNVRLSPRATLYSPPPSQTRKVRVVWIRSSPGSSRSMTSPSDRTSYLHSDWALSSRIAIETPWGIYHLRFTIQRHPNSKS